MNVEKISAVTLFVRDMTSSCEFYSRIPSFKLIDGGKTSGFTTFQIGTNEMYLNLERKEHKESNFGRIIFHVDDVDELYEYLKNDEYISKLVVFENEPTDASWGERFFHLKDPDGYQLSFATPIDMDTTDYEKSLIQKKKQRYKSVYKKRYRQ